MLTVVMIQRQMKLYVRVRKGIQMLVKETKSNALVSIICLFLEDRYVSDFVDSCDVDNGGCDKNADCCHDKHTHEVVCTCKTGYTNVGKGDKVKCKGTAYHI